jgi:hypothetical protein
MANQVVLQNSTVNKIGRDQYNIVYNQVGRSGSSPQAPTSLTFNDAPLGLLSAYFTGREEELANIQRIFDVVHNDMPARCVVHGMHGLGKTQLALQFANLSFIQQRYSIIFWISATTVEKLNQGFAKILHLVDHPHQFHPDHDARLTAARRWLEESGLVSWVLVVDNVNPTVADNQTRQF